MSAARARTWALAGVLVVLFASASTVSPAPSEAKACTTIKSLEGERLGFQKRNVPCRPARRYSHRLMRDADYDPPRYFCELRSPVKGGCTSWFNENRFFRFDRRRGSPA
jgi:hypothetical protein